MPLRRLVVSLLAAVFCAAAIVPAVAAAGPPVKVAVIVGPVGEATDRYRARAEAAAVEAERWTTDVVRVYSPDATWEAARRAMQGASIVIYLGHGNGWPSPYRSSLYTKTQNGLGLNPVAGVDDVAHQYFGEAYLAKSVRLAPGAVVLLHHLCYASGNSEPGRPEGDLDTARQRVDNFAAGFIAAGAGAVVAETGMGPAAYVHALLGRHVSITAAWQHAATANANTVAFPSERSPGFVTMLDPRTPSAGFERSLVVDDDVTYGALVANARGGGDAWRGPRSEPSLAARGVRAQAPTLGAAPVAGATSVLTLALDLPAGLTLDAGLQLGVRWAPLDQGIAVADERVTVAPSSESSPPPEPSPAPSTGSSPSSGPSPAPSPGPLAVEPEPPGIELVRAERPGELVTVRETAIKGGMLSAAVVLPAVPGLYRLSTTLHDRDGVALDQATQALVPALIVRVAGTLSVAYGTIGQLTVETGRTISLPVRVANTGTVAWVDEAPTADTAGPRDAAPNPWLVGRWVRLDALDGDVPEPSTSAAIVAPGTEAIIRLPFSTPAKPGTYLLLLDLVTPAAGSLAALGEGPGLVRVTVVAEHLDPGALPR